MPVLLPAQRDATWYQLGGVVRRSGLATLDDVFYFLPDNQLEDGVPILKGLLALAENRTEMARRRANLFKVARYTLFASEDIDEGDALSVSLGLLMAGEHH